MPLPQGLARFNRYFTNPIARRIAGRAPGFCILTHIGRRSGRPYRIPLNAFGVDGGFVFALTYGSDTDWVKNVMTAGEAEILHRGRTYRLERPRLLGTDEGMARMPMPVRVILDLVDVTEFLHLRTVD